MKFPYAKPFKTSSNVFGFGLEKGEPTPQEWIEKGAKLQQDMMDGKFPKNVAPVYKCCEDIELLDEDYIENSTYGNTGPYDDIVYFHTKLGNTAGVMIEMILLYPEIFNRPAESSDDN